MSSTKRELTLLAFDFGLKRTGVAVGQTITASATPLAVVATTADGPDFKHIDALMEQWQPDALVVGLPLNMDGSEQPLTDQVRWFAAALRERYHRPVHFADERLTTREARARSGPGSTRDPLAQDAVAAQIILEGWLAGAKL